MSEKPATQKIEGDLVTIANHAWPPLPAMQSAVYTTPLEIARRLRAERKFEEAIKILQQEIEKNNSAHDCSLLLSDILADMGNFDRAVKVMDELVRSDPKNKNYYMKRSVLRFKLDDRKGALEDVKKARAIDAKDMAIVKALVDVNASLGNYDEALKALEEIKDQNMIDGSVHERKKNLLKLVRMQEEADAYNFLLDAVRANMKEDSLLIAGGLFEKITERRNADYYEIGCALYRKMGLPHRAIELGEEAMNEKKVNDKMLRTLAFAYMDVHRFDRAIKIFEGLVKRNKDDPGIFADFAIAKLNSNDAKGALKEIDRAIEIDPYRELFYLYKGDIVARIDGVQQAIQWYEKAIKLNPLSQDAHDRMENAKAVIYRHAKKSDERIFR